MDPRIENRGLWPTFHKHLIVELFTTIRDQLGDEYWVDMESEVIVIPQPLGPSRSVGPDITVTGHAEATAWRTTAPTATPALLEADEAISEFEQNWIEIRRRDLPDPTEKLGARLVSVVELVSPSNKGVHGERDLRRFISKRRDYLLSSVSYLEIDLLRGGTRELPVAVERISEYPYVIWSSQAQERTRHYWAWGCNEPDRLPTVILPLENPATCSLDLAACHDRAFTINHWPQRVASG